MKIQEGRKLWNRAKEIIPSGTQLLSKRSDMFHPNRWPSYYKRASGVEVWDLDGEKYIDMSIMGIGTCILGYADEDVNTAVVSAVNSGSMNTLNCPEDVELAEILLDLHKWADMVRYTRTGGEAMAVAVRIARAYSGKDKVAFCGYHGWHDWYLSANLSTDKNLDGHLLPGLKPLGTPRALEGTAIPFNYNMITELENIMINHDIGTIIVEPVRHTEPHIDFLQQIRDLATKNNAVLIFDEITSGFRLNVGGSHLKYKVNPDIAVLGKAMGNGFPMGAIIGRKKVMDVVQDTFISSTYWTERIGPVAALATIRKLIRNDVPSHLALIGNMIKDGWAELAKRNSLDITVDGIPPLPLFIFNYPEKNAIHTLFTQEMLERGYLTSSKGVYVCFSHTRENVSEYLKKVDVVFGIIKKAIDNGSVYDLLDGSPASEGFQRLAL
jgi:glutamate-1-semialdehyde 2,1-aminomutase